MFWGASSQDVPQDPGSEAPWTLGSLLLRFVALVKPGRLARFLRPATAGTRGWTAMAVFVVAASAFVATTDLNRAG